jgi:hypothetical protein
VSWILREDVQEDISGGVGLGWFVNCDLISFMTADQHALTFEVVVQGRIIAQRFFRCEFATLNLSQKTMTFFMHIPKTGGTSIRTAIERHNNAINMINIYDSIPRDYAAISSQQFSEMSPFAVAEIDLVYGHFAYGLHRTVRRKCKYVTVIRDPFSYIQSVYFSHKYVLRRSEFVRFTNIFDFARSMRGLYLDNLFCRWIAGIPEGPEITSAHLELAKRHIERDFAYVGISDYSDDVALAISRYFGLPLEIPKENVTPKCDEAKSLDIEQFRNAVEPYLRLDALLYDYVLERFWASRVEPTRSRAATYVGDLGEENSRGGRITPFPDQSDAPPTKGSVLNRRW